MNADMRQRLMDYARAEIQRHEEGLRLRGGHGMTDQDGALGLRPRPERREAAEDDPATWVLAVFAIKTTHDSVSGSVNTPLEAVMYFPRVLGLPTLVDALWWENTQLRSGGASTKTCTIEFFTRRFDPWPGGSPAWEDGTSYAGIVDLTLKQQVVGGPGTAVESEVVRIFPEVGSGAVNFSASGSVSAGTLLELRPVSAARVRT